MPAGLASLGLAYYAGVKLTGYCLAAYYFNRHFTDRKANIYLAGATRTAIGLGVGSGTAALLELLDITTGDWVFLLLLIPIRFLEWLLLLWLFYRKPHWNRRLMTSLAAQGIVCSFVFDLPAILAAVTLPGGIWIC